MNSDYLQSLRQKLQRRVQRLQSANFEIFIDSLCQFKGFIKDNSILLGIVDDLLIQCPDTENTANNILQRNGQLRQMGRTDMEHAAISYRLIEKLTNSRNINALMEIGGNYDTTEKQYPEHLNVFRNIFIEPLCTYIDEHIEDHKVALLLLKRYKHKCEWFNRKTLFNLWDENTEKGEYFLAQRLYEYLYDQGLNFYIEPYSISGKVDFLGDQTGDNPFVADAKIFNPSKGKDVSYIAKGFSQLHIYAQDHNEQFGYLVIFKTCKEDLQLKFKEGEQSIPFINYNGKTMFLLVIDIFPHDKPASKRGELRPITVNEQDITKAVPPV